MEDFEDFINPMDALEVEIKQDPDISDESEDKTILENPDCAQAGYTRKQNVETSLKQEHNSIPWLPLPPNIDLSRKPKNEEGKLQERTCEQCGKVFSKKGHKDRHVDTVHR